MQLSVPCWFSEDVIEVLTKRLNPENTSFYKKMIFIYVYVCICVCGCLQRQEEGLDPLGLELWVLGTELGTSGKAGSALNCGAISPAPVSHL